MASSYIVIVNSSVQLCINSNLDAGMSFEILKVEFKNSGFRVMLVCTGIHKDRFDDFKPTAKESQFQGFEGFGGGTYGYATSYQTTVLVLSSAVIADVVLMYAGDIVAETEGCQSQKDRAEQARCKFERILSLLVFSTAAIGLMPVCQFQTDRGEQANHTASVSGSEKHTKNITKNIPRNSGEYF